MIKNAKKCLLLVDSTKADKTCMCRIAGYDAFDALITDKVLPQTLSDEIGRAGCEIIVG